MATKQHFARNEDGSIKTKQACQTPGCDHPNWHVCLGPVDRKGAEVKRPSAENFEEKFAQDPGHRERIREGMRKKHEARRLLENEINRERDMMVVRDYDRGHSKAQLIRHYGFNSRRLNGILDRADGLR